MTYIDRAEGRDDRSEPGGADAPVDGPTPASNRPMNTDDIRDAYAEEVDSYRRFEPLDRLVVGRYRRRRFGDASGRVLDVACGTGTNFRYLPDSVDLVGVDISPDMLAVADEKLSDLSLDGHVERMDAAALRFDDDSFDTVVSALSTCTFPEPVAALREMARVCRPDGRILLVEHGRSSVGPLARFQEWRADAHYERAGCRWTQEPRELVERAGLSVRDVETGLLGVLTSMEVAPEVSR